MKVKTLKYENIYLLIVMVLLPIQLIEHFNRLNIINYIVDMFTLIIFYFGIYYALHIIRLENKRSASATLDKVKH